MATNIKNISFDDGADIHVICTDTHDFTCTAIDLRPEGVYIESVSGLDTIRNFLPWHFVQSINQTV